MSESNCYCFRCRQSLIEVNSYGQFLMGCVNCNIWWEARGPVRPHLSREQLRAFNQAPNQMPSSTSTEVGDSQGVNLLTAALGVGLLKTGGCLSSSQVLWNTAGIELGETGSVTPTS